jgi:hypothetical protein
VVTLIAVLLWAAAAVCLWVVLIADGGAGYLVGYVVLQGAAIAASARARNRIT